MEKHHIRLTSSELGGLWANYISDSMFSCIYNYYLAHVEDREIRTILEHALDLANQHIQVISNIFEEEEHAVPLGFTNADVNVQAPKLFSDEFFLFYTKHMTKGALAVYSSILPHTFRNDIREYFMSCVSSTMELFNETTNLLLSKGLEVRSPYIPYLQKVDMVEKQRFLAGWFGEQRPLTALEITHFYSNIQTNFFGKALLTGFSQVVELEELREYLNRGKQMAQKHVDIFSNHLKQGDLPAPTTWDGDVYITTDSPFSDKLIMYHVSLIVASGMGNYGVALSASPRRDIATEYSRLLAETGLYAEDGANLLIKHEWMERPPHAVNRDK